MPRKEGGGVTGGAFHCAVPENIHTPPTEGFLILYPPPTWKFYAKISRNSVETLMEHFGPGENFAEKVVHLQRWSSLTGRSGPTETCHSIFENSHFTDK